MTQTEKYIWLINTIHKAKRISLADISDQWREYAGLNVDEKLSRATFNRWKDDIYLQFGVIISCQRAGGYKYYIDNPEIIEDNHLNKWMIDTIATGILINNNISISDRILVNKIPSGNDHLKTIITALKRNVKIWITYQRFDRESYRFLIEPYCLKLFENRWYMLGQNNRGHVKIYGLDRILKIEVTEEHFRLPQDFNAEQFFAPYFGVVIGYDVKPEKIVIRAYDIHRLYMASLPLHDSQKLIEDTGEYADFQLCVAPTYDLVMKLLSFGTKIEVLEPESLRGTMRGWASDLCEMYDGKKQ
ncbi:MAG: WYL domain-containing protein [Duncaniella sp.]|nr:WYL domain-containing protein [Duncaniella sp.]